MSDVCINSTNRLSGPQPPPADKPDPLSAAPVMSTSERGASYQPALACMCDSKKEHAKKIKEMEEELAKTDRMIRLATPALSRDAQPKQAGTACESALDAPQATHAHAQEAFERSERIKRLLYWPYLPFWPYLIYAWAWGAGAVLSSFTFKQFAGGKKKSSSATPESAAAAKVSSS